MARQLPRAGRLRAAAAGRGRGGDGGGDAGGDRGGGVELRPAALFGGGGWDALAAEATALYRARTRLDEPARAGDFREYVEDIFKPLFFARALGLSDIDAVPERPTPSFEEMARRMGCDASTVKAQLARYVEIRRAARVAR